jgi:hypothetical protein
LAHSDRDQQGDATSLGLFELLGPEEEIEIVSDPATSIDAELFEELKFRFCSVRKGTAKKITRKITGVGISQML